MAPSEFPHSAEEATIIEELLRTVPDDHRATIRTLLTDRSILLQSDRPEWKARLAQLEALRHPTRAVDEAELEAARLKELDYRATRLRVRLALVPRLGPSDVRAVVIRTPEDSGIPLVLLRDEDVTGGDLRMGLDAAARAASRHGVTPTRVFRRTLRSRKGTGRDVEGMANLVRMLREALLAEVAGVGKVRTLDMFTSRVPQRASRGSATGSVTGER